MNGTRTRDGRHHFTNLPDLASRRVGGSVVGASDELFAERENLIKPEPPAYSPHTFGHKGQICEVSPSPWSSALAGGILEAPRTAAAGDTANEFAVRNDRRVTHVRLR